MKYLLRGQSVPKCKCGREVYVDRSEPGATYEGLYASQCVRCMWIGMLPWFAWTVLVILVAVGWMRWL